MVARIALTTDFSPESHVAFAHALRLAVHFRCHLDLLHIHSKHAHGSWDTFPAVLATLQVWGMLPDGAGEDDVQGMTGVTFNKVEIEDHDPVNGLAQFVATNKPDLIVAATHGHTGLSRFFSGEISEDIAEATHTPTLLIGPKAKPFVDMQTGKINLRSVLLPVAEKPSPKLALEQTHSIFEGFPMRVHMVHVGMGRSIFSYGSYEGKPVHVIEGPVVGSIIEAADSYRANLIAMATEGHHGFMDALRGTTTNRVLHDAHCPVLAMPS